LLVTGTRDLLFVSTRFLFPVDSGGKIRTTQVLRGLKGGEFRVVLASPATETLVGRYQNEINQVCDEFHWWPEPGRGPLFHYTRMRFLPGQLPIPVRTDRHPKGLTAVANLLAKKPSVAVFDFAHAAVLAPSEIHCPSLIFTHNVEAEIFRRHRDIASNPVHRAIWLNQYRKMRAFEKRSLQKFDVVVAVADRDSKQFVRDYSVQKPFVIPTGVDLEFFAYSPPERDRDVFFCGSMDWMANQEGVSYFMGKVWDEVIDRVPDAKMTIVGRAPPDNLVQEAKRRKLNWNFTGFVDDVRPHMQGAAVSVIPLNVGGGTRLKAYEAMAMGSPIVSTPIGMEGLPVEPGQHYLCADDPFDFAMAVVSLLNDAEKRTRMAKEARSLVEQNFSYTVAARAFEEACGLSILRYSNRSSVKTLAVSRRITS
jgi:glycosyltransferase involved in cell wall biosynthesis